MTRNELRPIWYHRVPTGFWCRSGNRRAFMEWLERKLRIREPEDWYQLTSGTVRRLGGTTLLSRYYGHSVHTMVSDYVPWYDFKEWLFPVAPSGFWKDAANRRRYLAWLGEKLGYHEFEDWYQLTMKDVKRNRGVTLSRMYCHPYTLLKTHFPKYEWLEWRFSSTPHNFWPDPANRRRYLEWLGNELGFQKPEDWYHLRFSDLDKTGGRSLRSFFGGCARIVMMHFPEYDWQPWRFDVTPDGFWPDPANVHRYLEWLAEELGFKKPEDWYRLRCVDMTVNHGATLLDRNGCSVATLVAAAFPEYEWDEWKFEVTPNYFWDEPANCRRYLEWLGEQLGFKEPRDWYRIQTRDFSNHRGETLLLKFNGSPSAVVKFGFPEYEWHEWLFNLTPRNFWDEPANCRRYLEWLGEQLGFKEPRDWYRIQACDFSNHSGVALLDRFNRSPSAVVRFGFPEYEWYEWLFRSTPRNFWGDPANARRYLEWLGGELGFKKMEDWYQIQLGDLFANRGSGLTRPYGNAPSLILKAMMPEYDWKEWLFARVPWGFWSDRRNRRRYLEWLAEKLGIRDRDGWGRLRTRHFFENHGTTLICAYKTSVADVLLDTFPRSHPAVKGIVGNRGMTRKRRKPR